MNCLSSTRKKISLQLDRFGRWRANHIADAPFLLLLSVAIGIAAGLAGYLFKHAIAWISLWLTSGLNALSGNPILLVIPVVGIVLTGIVTRYVMRQNLVNGTRQLRQQLRLGDCYIAPSRMFNPIIASSITLGFGGSAGSADPIASAGGAIGANFGRWSRLSPEKIAMMIGCGAGAGIAGIFEAPLGGALFTIELMNIAFSSVGIIALFLSTFVSAATVYFLGGLTLDITLTGVPSPFDFSMLPFLLLFGVLSGFYSLYYNYIMKIVEGWLGYLRNPWIKNTLAGLAVGGLLYLFPSLYGEGYGVINNMLNRQFDAIIADSPFAGSAASGVLLLMGVAAAIVVIKCFATSATNNGGGVAGDFAPTLFAGCMLGYLFATALNTFFDQSLPVGLFVMFGMAGVMAGAIRAPLMAWMIVIEMLGRFDYLLPVLIASAVSYGIVRLFTSDSFYQHCPDRFNGLIRRLLRF